MDPAVHTAGSDVRPPKGPYTWEDFVALPDDDRRELIDGQLIEVDAPTLSHETINALLVVFLGQWVLQNNAGRVLTAAYRIRVSERRGVMPDVQFFRADNPALDPARHPEQGLASGRPDLAIEIISPTSERQDRVTKLKWYAQIGVPEYWIVSPENRTIERLLLRDGRYLIEQTAEDDDVFKPDTFPGLEIPLGKLWTVPAEPQH